MDNIKTVDGQTVTEEMLDTWSDALSKDKWPDGWANKGEIVIGRPRLSAEGSSVLSVKVPVAMKRAIEREANNEGLSTSDYVRSVLASGLLAAS
jgi:hypothetical protein